MIERDRKYKKCLERLREIVETLKRANWFTECSIPNLQISLGGYDGYSLSPSPLAISIHPSLCDKSDSLVADTLLHETGHAVDMTLGGLWRLPYPFSFGWNGDDEVYSHQPLPFGHNADGHGSYAHRAEDRANAWKSKCSNPFK